MTLTKLESVGTVLASDGMTYPMLQDGTPDMDSPYHVLDIENWDWWNNLSTADLYLILPILRRQSTHPDIRYRVMQDKSLGIRD